MSWLRWFLIGLVGGFAALAVILWRGGPESERTVLEFAAHVEAATVRRPHDEVFSVADVIIGGESRRAIVVTQASRIAWEVTPAVGQWLEVDAGLREDGWSTEANAVLFRVGLSYDGHYEDLVAQVVNPASSPGGRRWLPIRLDLSPYAGRPISLIFNTAAAPGLPAGHEHHAAWGAPVLVQR